MKPLQVDPGPVARTVAARVAGVPGVAGLSGGQGVEAATYYAGGKTTGVVMHEGIVAVHVVVDVLPVGAVAERVREAAEGALAGLGCSARVEVVIEDVLVSGLSAHALAMTPAVRAEAVGGTLECGS